MQERVFFETKSGLRLAGVIDRNEKSSCQKVIILLHGFGNNKFSERLQKNAQFFIEHDFAVFRADFRGRGESEGDISYATTTAGIEDAKAMLQFVLALPWVDKENILLWGNSYGGGIATLLAARYPAFAGLILISPCIDFCEMYRYAGVDIDKWRQDGFVEMLHRKRHISLYDDGSNYDIYKEAQNIKIPVLLVHGYQDEYVPLHQSMKMKDILSDGELQIIDNSNHGYYAKGRDYYPEVFNAIERWLMRNIKF